MTSPDNQIDILGNLLSQKTPEDQSGENAATSATSATAGPERLICSRKKCQNDAQFKLLWNNPKIHTPERRKIWLACSEHREYLADFLRARNFLKDVVGINEPASPNEPETKNFG